MMKKKKVRYCGNCNPDEYPGDVKKRLEELFPGEAGPTILVDGCARACLSKKEKDTGAVVMSAREVMTRRKKR
ncbi:MAG TPA: hypothetical protein PLR60_07670 [Syntrophorhabdaceae bacterium]|nr:hypothetical protein [Syntrophorhabdaceae bacterium]